MLTEHEPLTSVQVPPGVKVTVPVGVTGVPTADASATVAVQDVAWLITTVPGEQLTEVDESRLLTVTSAGVALLLLGSWVESPPYAPVMLAVPDDVGVKPTPHEAVPTAPATRVQLGRLNDPVTPLLAKVTVPVGVVGVADVSVTVAVHVVAWFITTGFGLQFTAVEVGWVTP